VTRCSAAKATRDTETLLAAGDEVRIVTRQESFCRGIVSQGKLVTKLEWVQDSTFRFVPVEPDEQLGWLFSLTAKQSRR
jgi:hypothetical protein